MDKDFFRLIENVDELLARSDKKLDDDCLICECFCVNVADIRQLCSSTVDLDLLKSNLSLGKGCTSCVKSFESWKDKIF